MLKSTTAPVQEEKEDAIAFYAKHTAQIEVGIVSQK